MLCSPYPLALSKVPFLGIADPGWYKQLPETFRCAHARWSPTPLSPRLPAERTAEIREFL